jgi:hypothetical protein
MPQISNRNDMIAALHEAAEIEHGLLLQYLFAALSMRQGPNEGTTPEQFSLLRQWKGVILGIAVDEMGHLGTVCNLLAAVGASPHFDRPGFPQPTGYYPFPFELVRFGDEALKRFVTAELPRGGSIADCLEDTSLAPLKALAFDLVPEVPSYKYVGDLYGHIADGIRSLPEDVLFIGSPTRQVDNEWSVNVDMRVITGRASALEAIEDLVRDGEGTTTMRTGSHYGKFCQMWRAFRAAPFEAARPVARNPRTRPPRGGTEVAVTPITEALSLAVAELFNSAYAVMLRLLAQFFANAGETQIQRDAIRSASARLMSTAIRPLAEVLTSLPATAGGETNAGPTFELYMPVLLSPEPKNRWIMLFEILDEVILAARRLGAESAGTARLAHVADTLSIMKRSLQTVARGGA